MPNPRPPIIVPKILAWLAAPGHAVPADVLAEASARTIRSLARQFGDPRQSEGTPLRGSALGKCPRAGWYQRQNAVAEEFGAQVAFPMEPMQPRSRLVFASGDMIETQLVALCFLSGVPVRSTNEAAEVPVLDQLVPAHIDLTIWEPEDRPDLNEPPAIPIPVEIKSMSRRGFEEAEKLGHPSEDFGYLDQLQGYMRALNAPYGRFICFNKEQGNLAEYPIERNDARYLPRAEHYVRSVLSDSCPDRPYTTLSEKVKVLGKEKAAAYAAANPGHKALDRTGAFYPFATGRQVLPKTCGYCSFRGTKDGGCWPGITMETVDGKPTWIVPAKPEKEQ